MNLLLSDNYPLRYASSLGNYAADILLPEVFGDLTNSPSPVIRLTDTTFFVCDHPATVVNVQVDGVQYDAWASSTATDSTGRAWCKLTMAAPVDSGSVVTAGVIGRVSPTTGTVIEHPADIMMFILGVAGKTWDWSDLKAELPGVKLAGRIDQLLSIRQWLDLISRSCGVVWSASGCRKYPSDVGVITANLNTINSTVEECVANTVEFAEKLILKFSWNASKGTHARSMTFIASPSPFETTGAPELVVEAPWLRTTADADALGRRLLNRLSTQRANVTVTTGEDVRAVHWVALNSNILPVSGDVSMFVLSSEVGIGDKTARITGEVSWGTSPEISLLNYSRMAEGPNKSGVAVEYTAGVATFTILDDNGKPLVNATVSLDGASPKKTDAQGKVKFEAKKGNHLLYVLASGYQPFELEIVL